MAEINFETRWVGGHGAISRASGLTQAFAESAHTFAFATDAGAGGAEAPHQIYRHVGAIAAGAEYIAEALAKMGKQIAELSEQGAMYDDQPDKNAADTARAAVLVLRDSAVAARDLSAKLQAAREVLTHLGMNDDAYAAVDAAFGDRKAY